jgi:hypothetical protein
MSGPYALAVAGKTNESTAVETVLGQMVLTGRVVTMAALLTQTAVAQTIVDAGGDDVMLVKANQPQRRSAMELIFAEPPIGDLQETAEAIDYWAPAVDRLCRHGGGLSPIGCTTGTGVGAHRCSPGKLTDPGPALPDLDS